MTKTSGPIYHLQIVLNKLLELLGFEALSLLPPYRTNPMKCLSTRTAKCWQCCYQLKGSLLWGFIHGGCGGGSGENGIIKMGEQRRQDKFKKDAGTERKSVLLGH